MTTANSEMNEGDRLMTNHQCDAAVKRYDEALRQCGEAGKAKPATDAVGQLTETLKTKRGKAEKLQKLDTELKRLAVQLGIKDAKQPAWLQKVSKPPDAREYPSSSSMSEVLKTDFRNRIEALRKDYGAGGWSNEPGLQKLLGDMSGDVVQRE